ncbi:hypothetical protein Ancab_018619 [Ancistrocladus abbreviatus]
MKIVKIMWLADIFRAKIMDISENFLTIEGTVYPAEQYDNFSQVIDAHWDVSWFKVPIMEVADWICGGQLANSNSGGSAVSELKHAPEEHLCLILGLNKKGLNIFSFYVSMIFML